MGAVIEFSPGKIIEVYYRKQMHAIQKQWSSVFAKNAHGANTKAYKWHTFSYGCYPATQGDKALALYDSHEAREYYLMSNDIDLAVLTDRKPKVCELSDYYVFPKNFAWTMAFTHEELSFFAKHTDYERLNEANNRQIEKQRDKDFNKDKG